MGLQPPHRKKHIMKYSYEPRIWSDSLDKRPKRQNMDKRFGTGKVRSMYRAGSLRAVSI
jgi:hypothetical protein